MSDEKNLPVEVKAKVTEQIHIDDTKLEKQLSNEKIKIKEGQIYINGKVLKEKYPFEIMHSAGRAVNEIQLAEDEYFVLSDNRNDMDDSRNTSFTKVRKKNIIGRVILRLNPFSLLGGPEQEEPKKEE